ncbi:MAG: Rpn family recombination-promoting nuclease/putative transposase, partial [Bacteroidota bacterium]
TQRIAWNTLKLSNKSYTNEKLAQFHSDVVYTCNLDKRSAYIYILIEQQTTPDPLLPFRFLKYNVLLLEEHINQKKEQAKQKPLPVIINLCVYSGKRTPYPYSVDIYDCFEDPSLARAEMFKPLPLIDLGQMREEELKQHGTAALMELLLKQARYRTFLKWIKEHPEEVQQLLDRYYGIGGIHYILGVESKHSSDKVIEAITAIAPNKQEEIMTALQQLEQRSEQRGEQRGIKRGIQKGIQARNVEIARRMLLANETKEKIHQFTGLSWVEIEALIREQKEAKT